MMEKLSALIAAVARDIFNYSGEVEISPSPAGRGDYTTNLALQLAGRLDRPARDIAIELTAAIQSAGADLLQTVSVAGPGFINLTLKDAVLWQAADADPEQPYRGQTILAEYSDPNPLKPLHAGHLYTTIVGDAIARLLTRAGAQVIRLNYSGDVGLHIGTCLWGVLERLGGEKPTALAKIAERERLNWLGECYSAGHRAYLDDPAAKAEIISLNRRVYALHAEADHTSPLAQIYWTAREWSYTAFKQLYRELQIVPFDRFIPESEIVDLALTTVRRELARGVYSESDGAVVFRGEDYGLHTRVFINSAGLPTYEAKDVGLLLLKWRDYHFDRSIVITAREQADYMRVMLKSVEQFAPEPVKRSLHLAHGTVKLPGNIKMSSRLGNTLLAKDILAAARQANRQVHAQDSAETTLAAVKYALLNQRLGGDIIYDARESVAVEGNSGPYLQYAHARACSILARATAKTAAQATVLEPAERQLLSKISQFNEVVHQSIVELAPHQLCHYLYELAQLFNRFYEHNRVIGAQRQSLRLELVRRYARTLAAGLALLGIGAPLKM